MFIGLSPVLTGSDEQTVGESYNLTCTVSGGGNGTITYQWHRNGTFLNESSTISFSVATDTSQILSFSPLMEADTGLYNCTVMRDFMTGTSNAVSINARGDEANVVDIV